ncbi:MULTISPECIES: hypothetical protein [unclassified Thiomonas]|nr:MULTISPECIES: hypothetical protein [unclassified Thiomonas]
MPADWLIASGQNFVGALANLASARTVMTIKSFFMAILQMIGMQQR